MEGVRHSCFREIRLAIINHAYLVPFDPSRPIFIASDACDTGYGGVVYHITPSTTGATKGEETKKISHQFLYLVSVGK